MAEKKKNFLEEIEDLCKKYDYLEKDQDIMIPTGLIPLDYANGKRIKVYDDDENIIFEYDTIGIQLGTVLGSTGESSTGKSAMLYAAAGSILGMFPEAECHNIDAENSFDKERFMKLTQLSPNSIKHRLTIHKKNATEDVADIIVNIAKEKLSDIVANTIKTDKVDMFGNEIEILQPTVVIVDSWSVLQPKDHLLKAFETGSKQEYSNNMHAATRAKINNAVVKLLNRLALIANINIFLIHHTQDTVQTGFVQKAAQNMHMGGEKKIGGGKSSIYLSANLFENGNHGKITKDGKGRWNYGIDGFVVGAKLAKSRTNATGSVSQIVFDYEIGGFNRVLTLFHYAATNDILKGSGQKYYFESHPEYTFSKKTFQKEAKKNPKLLSIMFDACKDSLAGMLSNTQGEDNSEGILEAFMF